MASWLAGMDEEERGERVTVEVRGSRVQEMGEEAAEQVTWEGEMTVICEGRYMLMYPLAGRGFWLVIVKVSEVG